MIIKRIFDKLFSSKKRKQNAQLDRSLQNAEMHNNRAAKMGRRIQGIKDRLSEAGGDPSKLSAKDRDYYNSHQADFTTAKAPSVQKQSKASTRAAGQAGQQVEKIGKTRKSLRDGSTLTVEGGQSTHKVRVTRQHNLADSTKKDLGLSSGPGNQTMVEVKSTNRRGTGKTTVTTPRPGMGTGKGTGTVISPEADYTTVKTNTKRGAATSRATRSGQNTQSGMKLTKGAKFGKKAAGMALVGAGTLAGAAYGAKKLMKKEYSDHQNQNALEKVSTGAGLAAMGGLAYEGANSLSGAYHAAQSDRKSKKAKRVLGEAVKEKKGGWETTDLTREAKKLNEQARRHTKKYVKSTKRVGKGVKFGAAAAGVSIASGAAGKLWKKRNKD